MNWTLLGIEPTTDRKAITAAYRSRVAVTNPEDKPEEFKALRAAYEEALQLAKAPAAPPAARTPLELWCDELNATYYDLRRRLDPACWQALLHAEICVGLGSRPQAEEALLRFFMQQYYLPQPIWQLLDQAFDWQDRAAELYEDYPRDFIDHVILSGIRDKNIVPLDVFAPGQDGKACDEFIRLYHRARRSPPEELPQLIEQLEALPEQHPYLNVLRCMLLRQRGELDEVRRLTAAMAEQYPDDPFLVMQHATQCYADERYEEALRCTEQAAALDGENLYIRRKRADCLGKLGREEDAKQIYYDLMDLVESDRLQMQELEGLIQEVNTTLIVKREATHAEHPEDHENTVELARCYLQNDRFDDALQLAQTLPWEQPDPYSYHLILLQVHQNREDYQQALEHLDPLIELLRTMQPDGTQKTARRMARLPEMLQRKAGCLHFLNDAEQAATLHEEALRLAPTNPGLLMRAGYFMLDLHRDERAEEILRSLVEVQPDGYQGHYLLAKCLHSQRLEREAFDEINRALDLERSDLNLYLLKLDILELNDAWDAVRELLQFLQEHGVPQDLLPLVYVQGKLAEFDEKDPQKAEELYRAAAARLEQGEELEQASGVYYRLAQLMQDKLDLSQTENIQTLLDLLDKGLAHNANNYGCLHFKGWLLRKAGRTAEALKVYQKLDASSQHDMSVQRALADLYYEDLPHNADLALRYYDALLTQDEANGELHFYAAFCHYYMGNLDEAERHFLRLKELDENDVDAYRMLCLVYARQNRCEEACAAERRAIQITREREKDPAPYYRTLIKILCRLGRVQQALDTIDEMTEVCGCPDADSRKADIYAQFGMWKELDLHLANWKRRGVCPNLWSRHAVWRELYQGRYDKARLLLHIHRTRLDEQDRNALQIVLYELFADWKGSVMIWENRRKTDENREEALFHLAQAYWWAGNTEQARTFAAMTMDKIEKHLSLYLRSEGILQQGRRALMLAILGHEQEARDALAKARTMPLCENCAYCACKDVDIYEAYLEEILGNYQAAAALYQSGRERWPDELDFLVGLRRLKRNKRM